jgi:hypothetical protein
VGEYLGGGDEKDVEAAAAGGVGEGLRGVAFADPGGPKIKTFSWRSMN